MEMIVFFLKAFPVDTGLVADWGRLLARTEFAPRAFLAAMAAGLSGAAIALDGAEIGDSPVETAGDRDA
jgi:hypothetical protein